MAILQLATAIHGQKMQQARQLFFERGELPESLLKPTILRSWQRCRRFGLAENETLPKIQLLDHLLLKLELERNLQWLQQGRLVMRQVFAQIRESRSMLILTDANGLILETVGDADFVKNAERIALSAGAYWDESQCGTNAIGTALAEEAAIQVLGGEHFFERHHFLASCASPIFGPDGKLIGVFNISGDHQNDERHTLALACLSAALIENRLFESTYARDILVYFQSCGKGNPNEGLAAVSADGQVLSVNRAGLELLGIRRTDAVRRDFSIVFETRLSAVIERLRSNPHTNEQISVNGRQIQIQLRHQLPPLLLKARESDEKLVCHNPRQTVERRSPVVTLETLNTGDASLQTAIDRARRILGRDIPILIQGESGAGKELFAQGFHNSGPRKSGPFVALNCAAIPEALIESELFGYQSGAYTGARKEGASGRIQQAHGGTFFLDEIGDMPLALQARLLRVLQERCVTPLGSTRSIPVDISLVCATHRNLREEVARGAFREDLYYRLNGLCVTLPPLRERTDIRQVIQKLANAEALAKAPPVKFAECALQAMERYSWPGNIRQLFNTIRVAIALLDEGETLITEKHLSEELFETPPAPSGITPITHATDPWAPAPPEFSDSLDEVERRVTQRTLEANGGNISAAARQLGISRNTLYRIIAKPLTAASPGREPKLESEGLQRISHRTRASTIRAHLRENHHERSIK